MSQSDKQVLIPLDLHEKALDLAHEINESRRKLDEMVRENEPFEQYAYKKICEKKKELVELTEEYMETLNRIESYKLDISQYADDDLGET